MFHLKSRLSGLVSIKLSVYWLTDSFQLLYKNLFYVLHVFFFFYLIVLIIIYLDFGHHLFPVCKWMLKAHVLQLESDTAA